MVDFKGMFWKIKEWVKKKKNFQENLKSQLSDIHLHNEGHLLKICYTSPLFYIKVL